MYVRSVERRTDASCSDRREAPRISRGKTSAEQLFAVVACKIGVTRSKRAGWCDVGRKPIDDWLTGLKDETSSRAYWMTTSQ